MRNLSAAAAATALLAAGMGAARHGLEAQANTPPALRNPAWLPRGELLRQASLGHRLLLADLYWLRTVQYMGETLLAGSTRWEALYPLADLVTDLDPRYGYAYQVAGANLAGLAHRFPESYRILEKGMRNVPDRYSLPLAYATNKFFHEGDFATAAVYARRAAEVGKRPHLALLAANLSLASDRFDEYDAAEAFLEESIQMAEMPELREQIEKRIIKVRTYRVLARVERAAEAYERRRGHRPLLIESLVVEGVLPSSPADPSGGTIRYDFSTGRASSSVLGERQLLRMTERGTAP